MSLLFIFMDGIGLGSDNPETNPFVSAEMPVLKNLLEGQSLTMDAVPINNNRTTLLALDACLNIEGLPQSATGQAALLTGRNVPAEIGYHFGPKPNPAVAKTLQDNNLFQQLQAAGYSVSFLNAYPPSYFESIRSGKRMYAAIPLAVTNSGLELKTIEDLKNNQAVSADFSAQGWHDHLRLKNIAVISFKEAGARLAKLAMGVDFALFEYWLSDYAGHSQNMDTACRLLAEFDQVLGALLEAWNDPESLILITSDHGNMEDLSTRKHTENPVPVLVIGTAEIRASFVRDLYDITDITPAILNYFKKYYPQTGHQVLPTA